MLENAALEEGYDESVAELIKHGATVNEQEITALKQLKDMFPERYQSLLQNLPELSVE